MTVLAVPAISAGHGDQGLARGLRIAQLAALHLLFFSLPIMEAPKNIACVLVALFWAAYGLATRQWGGRWDKFDIVFALTLWVALVSAWSSNYYHGISDALRVMLLGWIVKRSVLTARQGVSLLLIGCIGVWFGLAVGQADYLDRTTLFLQLPSVGHVNQSALYLALMAMCALGWTLFGVHERRLVRLFVGASALVFGVALMVTGSRAGLLAYGMFVLFLVPLFLWLRRSQWLRLTLVALVFAVTTVLSWGAARFLPTDVATGNVQAKLLFTQSMPVRLMHWHLAIDAWRMKPWFGHGPESYRHLTPVRVCAWQTARGENCKTDDYAGASHAHSVYLTALSERGIFGAASLLILLLTWMSSLRRTAREDAGSPFWIAGAAAFCLVAVAGGFNTTLRVEHGTLALALLGLWLAVRRSNQTK